MNNDKEIIAVGKDIEKEIMPLEEGINVVIARAEKQVEILKKVLSIAVKRTTHYDWTDMQGKPYLTSSGAEKLMPLFGVSLKDTTSKKEYSKDDEGQYYIYEYKGTFSWAAGSIEAIGACSSRDKFFAWDRQAKQFKPLPQVDETNIMKAAYSNMLMNGVTRLLGIRNLTWDMLKEFGIDQSKVARVEYSTGAEGGTTADEKTKQKEIANMLMAMAFEEKVKAQDMLEELTAFKGKDGKQVKGVRETARLTGKRLDIAYHKVKEEFEKYKKDMGVNDDDKNN